MAEAERRRLLIEARRWGLRYARTRAIEDLKGREYYYIQFYFLVVEHAQSELGSIWDEIKDKRKGEVARERLITLRDRAYFLASRFRRARRGIRRVHGRASYYIWYREPKWVEERIASHAYRLLRWKFPELETLYRKILRKITEILPPPPPPAKLFKIKVRLYNEAFTDETPTGQFQGFYDIDTILDEETGLPKWDWWLTAREIRIAKRDMWTEFNYPGYKKAPEWDVYKNTLYAYMTETKGIRYPETIVGRPPYGKPIPAEYIGRLTIEELIVGMSDVEPREIKEPEGVLKQSLMVSKKNEINWYSGRIDEVIWRPPKTIIERVKEELKL